MEAAEALVQKVLEGTKQFMVPHFQRPYAWREEQWRVLWDDLTERIEADDQTAHFIGPIVTAPARTVPEGVEKRLLIDGQQRLTTIVVIFTAIRDEARRTGNERLAERIQDLITNRHEDGLDRYKLLPTQGDSAEESDRAALGALVDGTTMTSRSGIITARQYFERRVRTSEFTADELFAALSKKLALVSIILGDRDDPHRIFESLNGKGRPLTQGDLIRNFFFMRIDQHAHERVYAELWRPMQQRLGEERLTDFIRQDLTSVSGVVVRETDVYAGLKARVDADNDPMGHLRRLAEYSTYYEVLLRPELARSASLRTQLARFRRLDVTVAHPLLLPVYAEYVRGTLSERDLSALLAVLETYILRRFVCGVATHGLNKVFAPLFSQHQPVNDTFVDRVANAIAKRDCPQDAYFRDRLQFARLYGGGERRERVKLLLERLEEDAGHKETIDTGSLTIEHIMPQTLTSEWTVELGHDAEETHDELLHTLGNLTLTGYNAELGNLPYATKRTRYLESHLELNTWFDEPSGWNRAEIERRAIALAEQALLVWPSFGPPGAASESASNDSEDDDDDESVTGTIPTTLTFRGVTQTVHSWSEVARAVATHVAGMGDEVFDRAVLDVPKWLNRDATKFRRSSRLIRLPNGAYMEANLSAAAIYSLCSKALRAAGVAREEWSVGHVSDREHGDDTSQPVTPSAFRARQLEFWTQTRKALLETSAFPSIRTPMPQYWLDIGLGRAGTLLQLAASLRDQRVGVKILMNDDRAGAVLSQLLSQREEIESELNFGLEWDPFPQKRVRSIVIWKDFDLATSEGWMAAVEWLAATAVKLHAAFVRRIARTEV